MQSVVAGPSGSLFKTKLDTPAELNDFNTWHSVKIEGDQNLKPDHSRWVAIDGVKPVKPVLAK
jgi:hypothetical protein